MEVRWFLIHTISGRSIVQLVKNHDLLVNLIQRKNCTFISFSNTALSLIRHASQSRTGCLAFRSLFRRLFHSLNGGLAHVILALRSGGHSSNEVK
jgi:hypothetical protein